MTYQDRAEQELAKLRCSVVALRDVGQHARQAGDEAGAEKWQQVASNIEHSLPKENA